MGKRVCMLTTDPDLVDTRIVNQATSLIDAGYSVRLTMPSKTAEHHSQLINGFEVCYVPPALPSRKALLRLLTIRSWAKAFQLVGDLYEEQLKKEAQGAASAASIDGKDHQTVRSGTSRIKKAIYKLFRRTRLTYSLLLLEVAFTRAVREFKPDIIQVHDLPMLRVGRMLAEELKAKLIYDAHEFYPFQYQDALLVRFWTERERVDIHSPDLIMTVNSFLADILKDFYSIDKPHVIHNTAPYETHFEKRQASRAQLTQNALPPDERVCVLLYLGLVAEERGVFEMLEMLSFLPNHYVLAIMGDGEVRKEMQERAAELQLGKRLVFHGMLPRESVPGLVVGADIGLVIQKPVAICQINCSPNRLSDYVMGGLPVAMSDLPFLRWFVETYECGVLFDPEDPRSIARAIQEIFEDPQRFEVLRQNALKAAECFNWDVEGQKFLKLYASLN